MSTNNIIKAWKNPAYRATLSAAERAALPANPAGTIELADEAVGHVAGGAAPQKSIEPCTMFQDCTKLGCVSTWCSITSPCPK